MTRLLDVMALDHAVGTLDGARYAAAVDRLDIDSEFADEVEAIETMLAPLCVGLRPMAPPAHLFDRIESAIEKRANRPDSRTIRASEGRWFPYQPGIDIKLLWQSEALGRRSLLMRVQPGAVYAGHSHDEDEECYVVEGEVSFGPLTLRAGDYHVAMKGGTHPNATSPQGALLLLTTGLH